MHPSNTVQCRPLQSHQAAQQKLRTRADNRCSFPHTSTTKTNTQNLQHQKRPMALFAIPPKVSNAYRLCVAPSATARRQAALHFLPQHPRKARIALLPSSPISPITRRVSCNDAHNMPPQTPTAFPSGISICPNDVLVYWAPTATKAQASSHSAPFTKLHLTATGTQPKRPRHTHKAPKTVRRSSKSCHYCLHVCKNAMSL